MSNPVIGLLQKRKAGRSIDSKPVSEAIVDEIIEAARLTPSCYNKQPWNYILAISDEAREKAAEIFTGGNVQWAPRAPVIVIGYTKAEDDCQLPDGREYHHFDLGMSAMNIMLAATHHGLTARPMAGFDAEKTKQLFDIAKEYQPMIVIAIGYPSQDESQLPDYYRGADKKPRERKEGFQVARKV